MWGFAARTLSLALSARRIWGGRELKRVLGSTLTVGAVTVGAVTVAAMTGSAFIVGCSSEVPDEAVGRVGLRLTAEKNGVVYRLRGATFLVAGPETHTLSTEEDPDATTISAEVAPGDYTITLQDGWYLERSTESGFEAVDAELLSENPLPVVIESSLVTNAVFRFLAEGEVVEPGPPASLPDVLGFEDETLWSSSATISLTDRRVQGLHSLGVVGTNFNFVDSVPLSNLDVSEGRVAVAIRLPVQQANPNWFGEVRLVLHAPSIGLNQTTIGTVALTGLPTGEFVDLEFTLGEEVLSALAGDYSDLVIRLGLNVPYNAAGTYRFDNLRFGGVTACDFGCEDGTCVDGVCELECPALHGDCDGDASNACETPLSSDSSNCGACDSQCAPGALCEGGVCVASVECVANDADCDGDAGNGCETDTSSDEANCGGCGIQCESGEQCLEGNCLGGDLNGSLEITTDWGSGYCGMLRLTNVGGASTTSWSVVIDPKGANFSPWNVNSALSGGMYTFTPLSWNAQIAPGATDSSVGFCASRPSGNAVAAVLSVSP